MDEYIAKLDAQIDVRAVNKVVVLTVVVLVVGMVTMKLVPMMVEDESGMKMVVDAQKGAHKEAKIPEKRRIMIRPFVPVNQVVCPW